MADKMPIWRTKKGTFRNGLRYTESRWEPAMNQQIVTQIGGTCAVHTLVRATEVSYRLHYRRMKKYSPPFDRFSVEHIENRVFTYIGQNKITPYSVKTLSTDIIKHEGILATEHYCLPKGLRGENQWLPHEVIPPEVPRYRSDGYWWFIHVDNMSPQEKYSKVVTLVENGPIYMDFYVPDNYASHDGFPHGFKNPPPKKLGTFEYHAVLLVGYGRYEDEHGQLIYYFVYLNTHGPNWGDGGYGRILALDMSGMYAIWVPRILPDPIDSTSGTFASGASSSRPS